MPERCLTFDCDGDTLIGILHMPEGASRDVGILIVIGGPQYRVGSHRQFVLMAREFCSAGYPVFRFDYRGMGDSTGVPRTFEKVDQDIRAAIDTFVAAVPGLREVAALGLCDAASAAMMYCCTDGRVGGLIIMNPWVRADATQASALVRHYYSARILERSFWTGILAGRIHLWKSASGLLEAMRRARKVEAPDGGAGHFRARMLAGLGGFRRRVLLVQSGNDLTAREFDELARTDGRWSKLLSSSLVQRADIPDGDHTLSSATALKQAASAILRWLGHTGAAR